MKKTNVGFYFLALCCIFISSCSRSGKKDTTVVIDIFPDDSLSTFVGLPTFIKYYDDKLFVVESSGNDGFIKVIDIINDSLMFSFANIGNGPNEYLSVIDVDIYDDDNHGAVVGIYDLTSRVYQVHSYNELLKMKYLTQPIVRKRFPESRYCSFIRLDDSMYLATNLKSGGKRFILYDDSLDNGKSVIDYRPKPSKAFPDEIHAIVHNGRTFVSPDRKKIGNVIFAAQLLSVFTVEDQDIQPAWDYIIKEMDYTVRGNSYQMKTRGYRSGAFSNKYVYGLYCGKPEDEGISAEKIHVFSYNGELIKEYRLAYPAYGICVDEAKNTLFTIVHEPEPKILIYHLEDI